MRLVKYGFPLFLSIGLAGCFFNKSEKTGEGSVAKVSAIPGSRSPASVGLAAKNQKTNPSLLGSIQVYTHTHFTTLQFSEKQNRIQVKLLADRRRVQKTISQKEFGILKKNLFAKKGRSVKECKGQSRVEVQFKSQGDRKPQSVTDCFDLKNPDSRLRSRVIRSLVSFL